MYCESYEKYKSYRIENYTSSKWSKLLSQDCGNDYISYTGRNFTYEEFCQEMQNNPELFERFATPELKRQLKLNMVIDDAE